MADVARLLVIEDNQPLMELINRYLMRLGYRVEPCSDAAQAWAAYEGAPASFSLVLADLTLANGSSEDVLRRMIRLNPDLRILVSSGYPFDVSTLDAGAGGRVGFLAKPFMPRMLAEAVRSLLGPAAAA